MNITDSTVATADDWQAWSRTVGELYVEAARPITHDQDPRWLKLVDWGHGEREFNVAASTRYGEEYANASRLAVYPAPPVPLDDWAVERQTRMSGDVGEMIVEDLGPVQKHGSSEARLRRFRKFVWNPEEWRARYTPSETEAPELGESWCDEFMVDIDSPGPLGVHESIALYYGWAFSEILPRVVGPVSITDVVMANDGLGRRELQSDRVFR